MQFKKSEAVARVKNKETVSSLENKLTYIPVENIIPDPENKEIYDSEHDDLLIASVSSDGILQPLLVRPSQIPYQYMVIAGHRRLNAAKLTGQKTVPCMIRSIETEEEAIKAKIELVTTNQLVRERTPAERAKEIEYLEKQIKVLRKLNPSAVKGETKKLIAEQMNMGTRQVADYQNINKNLPEPEKEKFDNGDMSVTEAVQHIKSKKKKSQELKVGDENIEQISQLYLQSDQLYIKNRPVADNEKLTMLLVVNQKPMWKEATIIYEGGYIIKEHPEVQTVGIFVKGK